MHDLHDLLSWIQPGQEVGAQGALADTGHELLDNAEVHVRFEQRQTDLAQRDVEIRLGDPGFAAQTVDHALQPGAQRFEHWLSLGTLGVAPRAPDSFAAAPARNGCPSYYPTPGAATTPQAASSHST